MINEHLANITRIATAFHINADVVIKQVMVESEGDQYAWNPEPRYRYLWDVAANRPFRTATDLELADMFPPRDFPSIHGDHDNEWWGQQASWGLMQLMGAVAREMGFKGRYLPQLTDPVINLGMGCQHLAALIAWAHGDIERALAAYNGGKGGNDKRPLRNQAYASKVLNTQIPNRGV